MAVLSKSDLLKRYEESQSYILKERKERQWAAESLQESSASFSFSNQYDIFLSHSYSDSRIVKQIRDMLTNKGYSVYVDWIEDKHLERGKVTKKTAKVLRNRMDNCSSLIYLTSPSAETSVWMPWELGYMDSHTERVAVAPIIDDEDEEFTGREYLGIYPYLDLTGNTFYIEELSGNYVKLKRWLKGENPE